MSNPEDPISPSETPDYDTVSLVLDSLLIAATDQKDTTAFSWIWRVNGQQLINAAAAIQFKFPEKPTRDWARSVIKKWITHENFDPVKEARRILTIYQQHPRAAVYNTLLHSLETRTMAPVQIKLKPTIYNGSSSPTKYFQEYERIAKANQWGDIEKLTYLPAYLDGRAKDHYSYLEATKANDLTEWTTLKKNIIDRFTNRVDQTTKRQQLGKMKQNPAQTVTDFVAMLREAAADLTPPPGDEEILAIAQRGLLPHLRRSLAVFEIKTVSELSEKAATLEANLYWARNETEDLHTIERRLAALELRRAQPAPQRQRDNLRRFPTTAWRGNGRGRFLRRRMFTNRPQYRSDYTHSRSPNVYVSRPRDRPTVGFQQPSTPPSLRRAFMYRGRNKPSPQNIIKNANGPRAN